MTRRYTKRSDGSDSYLCYLKNGTYIEIPDTADEADIQDRLDSVLVGATLNLDTVAACRDDVYVAQEVVRTDYTIGTPEGAKILKELREEFPDYANYDRIPHNFVGKYSGYREPYSNSSISWYDFGVKPSEALQLAFSASYLNSNLHHWYGLKFDLVTREVLFKAVVAEYIGSAPVLPKADPMYPTYYALTHAEDGTVSEWVDAYVYATPRRIKDFCAAHGLDYPLFETTHRECDLVWCWGFVFNKNTLDYGPVKAYARYLAN